MATAYSKAEILQKIEKAADDMEVFYQQEFINYRGRTIDTNEYYTEVIAEWCCEHLYYFEQIPQITRNKSYRTLSHDGVPNCEKSNRIEEMIAMAMFRQREMMFVGQVIDYQTPLKNKQTDRAGKIDLLSYDGNILHVLELKEPESTETMLRCVLEGYTYLQTVNHKKLLIDFSLPMNTKLEANPFVFIHGKQWEEMQENRPWLLKLINLVNCTPYYIKINNDVYFVEESI